MVAGQDDELDYYAILQVAPDATPGEIERSYRRLAARRSKGWWRPGRAARELAAINAAYGVLGYPERRREYDHRQAEARAGRAPLPPDEAEPGAEEILRSYRPASKHSLPRVQFGRQATGSPLDGVMIVVVVLLALFAGSLFLTQSPVTLAPIQDLGETLGFGSRRRAPTPAAEPSPQSAEVVPSPAPTPLIPATQAPLGALPPEVVKARFAGSEVTLNEQRPPRQSVLAVSLKLVRDGAPVANANVFLVAHYRTVDERQPPGTSTVRTDASGVAKIEFNVEDATPNYEVKVDVTALVEGQQAVFQTAFTPR
jgi:hypothetical protein